MNKIVEEQEVGLKIQQNIAGMIKAEEDALENRPKIDLRYVNLPPSELDPSLSHTYVNLCPTTYQQNMDKLKHEKDNFFKNKLSLGQYAGYSDNAYIDRTRYATSTDPLPVNPDFFMDGGGTFA